MKPGWTTSEGQMTAITTLVAAFIGLAVAYKVVTPDQAATFNSQVPTLLAAVATVFGCFWQAVNYIHARSALKSDAMKFTGSSK